jgi:HD-like signal output (HDOD) protein
MNGAGTIKHGEWMLLLMQLPGQEPQPVGILLLDSAADKLYVRLSDLNLEEMDPDVAEVWNLLGSDLEQQSREMGGLGVFRHLENEASLTFTVGNRREAWISTVESTLEELFRDNVTQCNAGAPFVVRSGPAFSATEIAAVFDRMPVSRLIGMQALKALQDPHTDLRAIEAIVSQDPVLAGHFIDVANSALLGRGVTIRSVGQALLRLGFDDAKLHIWGMSVRRLYSSPHLERIWNHSVSAVRVVRELGELAHFPDINDAMLAALVHDVGRICFAALGDQYLSLYAQLLADGHHPNEIERRLCGVDHAQIGADLLSTWKFPMDLTEAVRYHHAPSSRSTLTKLLYVAESWSDNDGEDIYDRDEHARVMEDLHFPGQRLALGTRHYADLNLLRFVA